MEKLYNDILNILRNDCRYSASKVAAMLGQKEETVKAAIEKMEAEKIIVKYAAIVNSEKLNDNNQVTALIEVKVTPQRNRGFDAIAEDIYCFSEVKDVYLMSGGFDLAVLIEGKSLREVAAFVSEKLSVMDTVVATATHFILKKYKTEGVIIGGIESIKRNIVG
ncbi:MAG: Lrp/AsnC family transcriptional regulator [Firmicutes bacterium]|nr:Lrp/AsnC family transcriptional regulator [Bacillota bacterium]